MGFSKERITSLLIKVLHKILCSICNSFAVSRYEGWLILISVKHLNNRGRSFGLGWIRMWLLVLGGGSALEFCCVFKESLRW